MNTPIRQRRWPLAYDDQQSIKARLLSGVATQEMTMKKSAIVELGNVLTQAMSHVDWKGIEKHTTKGTAKRPSRDRTYLSGIPMDSLRKIYKKNKATLAKFGFQFFCVSRTPTGEVIQRNGHKIEICKRQWEVRLWLSDNNKSIIAGYIQGA